MEIKRTTEILIETNRRFVIRQSEDEQIFCSACGEATQAAEAAAILFGITCRAVYQLVENGCIHFAETAAGAMLICPSSLAQILETGAKPLPETIAE